MNDPKTVHSVLLSLFIITIAFGAAGFYLAVRKTDYMPFLAVASNTSGILGGMLISTRTKPDAPVDANIVNPPSDPVPTETVGTQGGNP
ncbi:MAG: hypothetical protein M3315_01130 [Actinomycetota bacterium]|nr:hypothetical protein [Actinomycetota bacterium]